MTNSSNRRPKSSNKTIKPKDQVVDVTPLNPTTQSKTSSKIQSSSSTGKASSTRSIPIAKKLSIGSGGDASTKTPSGKNKDFESRKSQKEKSSDQVDIIGEVKPIKATESLN